MRKYSGIPELLEQYMKESGADERWITVREFCDRFELTRYEYNTVSGFLRRLESGPFREFPYIVLKTERIERSSPSAPQNSGTSLNEDVFPPHCQNMTDHVSHR